MKRSRHLVRKTPMKRSSKPLKRTRLSPMSEKRKAEVLIYSQLRKQKLEAQPMCEVKTCKAKATQVHHRMRRGANYLNLSSFMSVCAPCHRFIEENGKKAEELGYLIRTKPGA